ncbi:hypothetical protein N7532_002318 [Penicillium argentinense]|uniref:CENP-V/GFA domain-containing protein n=1 Tax=Penicillium argentinense TaxID=1131581 RepID=A0A9W9G074_9EURO|nr:uncharacterized protein N7532_002318 [Penicillium argentinense]KAJ5109673.1 hypothetical protein N7532_002318 [Penicillium argentinense]
MPPTSLFSPALRISYIMQLAARLKTILGSYCHIAGSLLTFVDDIEIHQGTNSLKEYRFGSHTIQIFFCGICGANVYNKSVNPKFRYGQCAINMRLLHDIDLGSIKISKGDGKNIHLPPLEEDPL